MLNSTRRWSTVVTVKLYSSRLDKQRVTRTPFTMSPVHYRTKFAVRMKPQGQEVWEQIEGTGRWSCQYWCRPGDAWIAEASIADIFFQSNNGMGEGA